MVPEPGVFGTEIVLDADGDLWCADLDCDDAHVLRFPGAPGTCDSLDNDCDSEYGETEHCVERRSNCTCATGGSGGWVLALAMLAFARRRQN